MITGQMNLHAFWDLVITLSEDYAEVKADLENMKASFALILPLLLSLSNAQVPHWGTCPEPPLQPDFILKKFLGTWYEVAKLPAQYENGRCIETNLSMNADGTIKVFSSEIRKGQLNTLEGTGVVEDINQPAKLGISYSYRKYGEVGHHCFVNLEIPSK
ncbi:hypothetical protein SKAU_G00198550 [Synaphobranchus kaupii]|uniref:Apolipoprotein D n=1 Tax=Synaphobranchus kaupii TaxID=118154 RepID=A0A9Q1FEX8_SYNKA|nr:hypothetical protein SKAU_G00198550 [Synaphobranchus kaupii]